MSPGRRRERRRSEDSHRHGAAVSGVIKINGGVEGTSGSAARGVGRAATLVHYLNLSHFGGSLSRAQRP